MLHYAAVAARALERIFVATFNLNLQQGPRSHAAVPTCLAEDAWAGQGQLRRGSQSAVSQLGNGHGS